MLRRVYDWCIAAADKPYALWLMGLVSFAESSFFPIPPDTMLIPMSLARPERAWSYATLCTLTSVAGGVFGYFIGAYLYGTLGHWLIALYHLGDKVEAFRDAYQCYGALIILIKGLTPIPYKIVTITSGFAGYNIWAFIGFSLIARGMRFYLAALVLNRYGARVRVVIEKRLGFWVTLSVGILVAGIIAAIYLPGMSWWPGMPQWLNFCPAK
jgi:membrane protein YqaA with SNARE-associated domain